MNEDQHDPKLMLVAWNSAGSVGSIPTEGSNPLDWAVVCQQLTSYYAACVDW